MQLFVEADLKTIINYWAKDYTAKDEGYVVEVVKYSVDISTGKVLFVLEKVEKELTK